MKVVRVPPRSLRARPETIGATKGARRTPFLILSKATSSLAKVATVGKNICTNSGVKRGWMRFTPSRVVVS
ncbi:hypothetical protein D3C85_1726300 [compost metagenome]